MKIPIRLKICPCGGESLVWFQLEERDIQYKCQKCGEEQSLAIHNLSKPIRIVLRAQHELFENNDYSLSIVLSAMAFECEMNRLFKKWKMIGAIREKQLFLQQAELDEALREMRTVFKKLTSTASLMSAHGISGFISNSPDLQRLISEKYAAVSIENLKKDLKKEFERNLFFPRNNVVHIGKQYDERAAKSAREFALLGMTILEKMDEEKRTPKALWGSGKPKS